MNEPDCCERCGLEYQIREGDDPSRYCDPCAQSALIEVEKERDALKARLEEMRPVPPVSDWLASRLHSSRYRAQSTAYDENFRSFNASLRDWLEVFLGEPIESDPWKDRRGK